MKCKNCNHKVIFYGNKWIHWNSELHIEKCLCKKPKPNLITLDKFKEQKNNV